MYQFDVVTLFPQMFDAVTQCGVTGRARERGLDPKNQTKGLPPARAERTPAWKTQCHSGCIQSWDDLLSV